MTRFEQEPEDFANDMSEEEEVEEFANDVSEQEEFVNDVSQSQIVEEEEEFVVDLFEWILDNRLDEEIISENMETRMVFDDQQQQLNQTSGRPARMRVNINNVRIVPEIAEEDDVTEFVDQDMYESFQTRTYYAPPTMEVDDKEEASCAICLLEYKDEYTIATLQCRHEFHAECINKWLHRKNKCPFCRASVLPTTHDSVHILILKQFN